MLSCETSLARSAIRRALVMSQGPACLDGLSLATPSLSLSGVGARSTDTQIVVCEEFGSSGVSYAGCAFSGGWANSDRPISGKSA
jgi:hypothetical protein